MTNSCFVTMVPQASHVSPLPGPPQTFGKLSSGKLPSASLLKIRRRRASSSMIVDLASSRQEGYWTLVVQRGFVFDHDALPLGLR
jgi:hypothetical protein